MCHLNHALFLKHFIISLLRSNVSFLWPSILVSDLHFYNCNIIVAAAEVIVVAAVIANIYCVFFCVSGILLDAFNAIPMNCNNFKSQVLGLSVF